MTTTTPTLQNAFGNLRLLFQANPEEGIVVIERRENCPKASDDYRYAGRFTHETGNARYLWKSLTKQGWRRIR